jgi:hypothetical protein
VARHPRGSDWYKLCGGYAWNGPMSEVWRLDLGGDAALDTHACACGCTRWESLRPRRTHLESGNTGRKGRGRGVASDTECPALSCGRIAAGATAIAVEDSNSAAGQVLLLGGRDDQGGSLSTVHPVDLVTGVCTPQAALLSSRAGFAAVRIPDGRVACAGGCTSPSSAEVWGPPASGAPNAAWTCTQVPAMSVGRHGFRGCAMSDGRYLRCPRWPRQWWSHFFVRSFDE